MYDLSIIVCVYNLENHIQKCLQSIFNQSRSIEKIQVIVVDDGSTDKTPEILSKCKYPITVLSKKNGGVSSARNVGLEQCRNSTRYVAFVDGDDTITTDYIKTFYEITGSNEADIIEFNANFIFERFGSVKKKLLKVSCSNNKVNELTDSFLKEVVNNAQWFICSRFYKINLFDNISFPLGKRYEDLITIPLVYLKAKTVFSSDKSLYNYFKNEGSITNSVNIYDLDDMFYAAEKFDTLCTKKDLSEIFKLVIVSNAFAQCFRLYKEQPIRKQAVILSKKTGINYNFCLLKVFMSIALTYSKEFFKKSLQVLKNILPLYHKRRNI